MKFAKEELSEALKARMTANGEKLSISDRTIKANVERICARLDKAGNEDELDAVVDEYLPDFLEINGNIRKDNSDFVKGWEKANKQKAESEEQKTAQPERETAKSTDDRLEELMKEIQAMKAEAAAARDKADRDDKALQIRKSLTDKGVKDEKWLSSYMRKLNITKESDVETETADALALYNLSSAAGGRNISPNGSGHKAPKEEDFDDVIEILKRERG